MSTVDPFNDSDIVKRGYVHIKRPPSNMKLRLKAWQKRYFVLVDATVENGRRTQLEIHDNESVWRENRRRQTGAYVVDLRSVTSVQEYHESRRFPNACVVTRSGQSPLVLGASTGLEIKEWVAAINLLAEKTRPLLGSCLDARHSPLVLRASPFLPRHTRLVTPSPVLDRRPWTAIPMNRCQGPPPPVSARFETTGPNRSYAMKIEPTDASLRNGLLGEYEMNVRGADVVLRKVGHKMAYIQWPIAHIRSFKSHGTSGTDLLTLDANMQCGSKVGRFMFRTRFGSEIVNDVLDAAKTIFPRQTIGTEHEPGIEKRNINKNIKKRRDPYLDLLAVDSETSFEEQIPVSTTSCDDIPSPLEVQWRSLQTQHADNTAQMLQSLKGRGSENTSADSAIFMSECSSDNGGTVVDCRKETTWISTDVFEETFDFSPPPPPPRNRSALLDDPIPPPLPSRTSV